jgi:hypothetical protein
MANKIILQPSIASNCYCSAIIAIIALFVAAASSSLNNRKRQKGTQVSEIASLKISNPIQLKNMNRIIIKDK